MSAPLRPFPVRNADPDDWRNAGAVEHVQKYEQIAQSIGVDVLLPLLPRRASPARVKAALDSGDEHLNTIPLSCWDRAAGYVHREVRDELHGPENVPTPAPLRGRSLSLAERVCVLKHVARYHLPFGG